MGALIGGWAVGPVTGRRPAGPARQAVHPRSGTRGELVLVDARFLSASPPDHDAVALAAGIGHPSVVPLLDAGVLEDGGRWYVAATAPGPVLDPDAARSPRRSAAVAEGVARALAALHGGGAVHGLVGAQSVVPAAGRHRDGGGSTTLLLDAGVAPLLGAAREALALASGVLLPADRGPESDVHALGGLLLRMLTAAAPAGSALAALPVELRALLSEMLAEDPGARPAAAAVAGRLARLGEALPATGPVDLPVAPRSAPVPVQRPAVPPVRRVSPQPPVLAATAFPPRADGPVLVPTVAPSAPHVLRTGPIPVAAPARRAPMLRKVAVAAGGIGLAALLIGIVTHLPTGEDVGVRAAAAGADALSGAGAPIEALDATQQPAGTATSTAAAKRTAKATATPSSPVVPEAPAPAFLKPTAPVPSPLTKAKDSPTPSRSTGPTAAPSSAAPSSSAATTTTTTTATTSTATSTPSQSSTSSGSSSPSSTASESSSPSTSTSTGTADPSPSSSASDSPSSSAPSSSAPTESSTPSSSPSESSSPSADPSDTASSEATPDPSPSAD